MLVDCQKQTCNWYKLMLSWLTLQWYENLVEVNKCSLQGSVCKQIKFSFSSIAICSACSKPCGIGQLVEFNLDVSGK